MKTRIGKFQLGEPVGSTPNARVYSATEEIGQGLTRDAVIKVLRIVGESSAERDEIRKEAEILVKLGSSPNVVQMLDFGIDDEVGPWLAMERLGESLKTRITAGPADPKFVRRVASDALHGLSAIHNNNPSVLHRDVKPAHLLCTPSGSWKLIDFGLASARDEASTLNLLTVQYAAPELLDRQLGAAMPSTDLYSLGMTLYHLALGEDKYRPEFPSIYFDDLAKWDDSSPDRWPKWMFWHCSMEQTAKPLSQLLPGFPQDLSDAIAWMMTKQPDQRAGTAEEVLASLTGGGGGAGAPSKKSAAPSVVKPATAAPANTWNTNSGSNMSAHADEAEAKKSGVSPMILALAAVVLLVAVGALGFIFFNSGGGSPYEIKVPAGQQGNTGLVSVEGRVVGLPQGWSAEMRTATGEPIRLNIDPSTGGFVEDVAVAKVGELEIQLALINGAGKVAAEKRFKIERLPPVNVDLTFQTVPPVPDARIRVTSPTSGEEFGIGTTDGNGRFNVLVAYGPVKVEVTHERYERFVETGDSGSNASHVLEIPLRSSSLPARFKVSPPNAEVEIILADTAERVQIRLDSSGSAEQLLPLGRHIVLIRAPGFVEEEHQFEVTRLTQNRFQEQLLRVGQVENADATSAKDMRQLSEAQLLILPLSELREVVEAYAGLAGLRVEEVPELNSVRISGVLLNEGERQKLIQRVQKAGRRVQVEASSNPNAIGRELRRWMVDQGDTVSSVRALPDRLFVRFDATSPISRDDVEREARRYVYESTLVELGP